MADSSSHGGVVIANPVETIMKRIRASFRESGTLLLSIVKGKGTIVATDYINEDLQSIVKKYEAVEKENDLKMLRRPRDVLSRISDPALPSRLLVWSLRTSGNLVLIMDLSQIRGSLSCVTLR